MELFSLEHSKAAYRLDFAVYGGLVTGLAALLLFATPRAQGWEIAAFALFGLGRLDRHRVRAASLHPARHGPVSPLGTPSTTIGRRR